MLTPSQFLRALQPEGPWSLAAIDPDRHQDDPKKIRYRTMGTDEVAVADFLYRHSSYRNVHYQLGLVRPGLGKRRAGKRDIVACVALHCEIHPPERVDAVHLARWQRRKLAELVTWARVDLPRPTHVVFSGTGYQLIWRLDEPTELIEAVESRNRALALLLGGDVEACGVERLLRLPGTMNHPDETKRADFGRTGPVLAELLP